MLQNDYEFIDLSGLDENIKSQIKAILRSEVAADVLKLPWDNGDKDYNSNSVILETTEAAHWERYGKNNNYLQKAKLIIQCYL